MSAAATGRAAASATDACAGHGKGCAILAGGEGGEHG